MKVNPSQGIFIQSADEADSGERIAHGSHPVLAWMMDNIHIRTDLPGILDRIKPSQLKKLTMQWL
jgi:hypothetical protein